MSRIVTNLQEDSIVVDCSVEGLDASWSGSFTPKAGFAFGGKDGRILVIDDDGEKLFGTQDAATPSREAINGIAFLPNWVGISTRHEVCFVDLASKDGPTNIIAPYGGHGVEAISTGEFVAPLGRCGLLSFRPAEGENLPIVISRVSQADIPFYKVAAIARREGGNLLVSAARREGVVVIPHHSTNSMRNAMNLTFDSFDAVDVCKLSDWPGAIAAIGKNRTILLFHDVLEQVARGKGPVTFSFANVKGVAYRIAYAANILIVLTSHALYFFKASVNGLMNGETTSAITLEYSIKAIDINVVRDRWLMVVTSYQVFRFDLKLLPWNDHAENWTEHEDMPLNRVFPQFQAKDFGQLVGVN